jgi:D-sedoheptulose 7-phosphate isomerase
MSEESGPGPAARLAAAGDDAARAFGRRSEPTSALAGQADAITAACHAMAVRFHQGGKLVVFGTGTASTDAQHVAVEFVHPVIVGKRALPAISLTTDVATVTGVAEREGLDAIFSHQLRYLAAPSDIALGISADGHSRCVLAGLSTAKELGLLTIALVGGAAGSGLAERGVAGSGLAERGVAGSGLAERGDGGAIAASPAVDHTLLAYSDDPCLVKEMHVTIYHVLWELVHVFFEQPGVLGPEVLA